MTGFIILLVVDAVVGILIGRSKGRPYTGFYLGLFLGVIGWIIMAFIPRVRTFDDEVTAEVRRREVARAADKQEATS